VTRSVALMDSSVLVDVASFFCCIRVEIKLAIDVLCCTLSLILLDNATRLGLTMFGLAHTEITTCPGRGS
jgi:hypothetical protein